MKAYKSMSKEELMAVKEELQAAFEDAKGKGLKLNMARGLPSAEQLDMEADFFNTLNPQSDFMSEAGIDCRNYGELIGITEARKLMADMMEVILLNYCDLIACKNYISICLFIKDSIYIAIYLRKDQFLREGF